MLLPAITVVKPLTKARPLSESPVTLSAISIKFSNLELTKHIVDPVNLIDCFKTTQLDDVVLHGSEGEYNEGLQVAAVQPGGLLQLLALRRGQPRLFQRQQPEGAGPRPGQAGLGLEEGAELRQEVQEQPIGPHPVRQLGLSSGRPLALRIP